MKKLLFILCCISAVSVQAQSTSADTLAIKETCLNYVQGFYTADTVRVAKAVHPELVKRVIVRRTQTIISTMSSAQLIKAATNFKIPAESTNSDPFQATVSIYDIDMDIAIAKVTTNKLKFFDYVQLGKINGEWKIINVLWAFLK